VKLSVLDFSVIDDDDADFGFDEEATDSEVDF